jgi:hypothetical protein
LYGLQPVRQWGQNEYLWLRRFRSIFAQTADSMWRMIR